MPVNAPGTPRRRLAASWASLIAVTLAAGCHFSERPFPIREGDYIQMVTHSPDDAPTTRAWLQRAHRSLKHLLPKTRHDALVTEDLVRPDGQPVDVLKHFGLRGKNLRTLIDNAKGLAHSAQGIGGGSDVDEPAAPWPGFTDVWIPVAQDVKLAGRLGYATRDGQPLDATCIVIIPGIFGDNAIQRSRDLAAALRDHGFHVLALELRGHGRTEAAYPNAYYHFGVVESVDLLLVSQWLESQDHITKTGLVGVCWGANISLLAAWYDNHPTDDPSISREIAERLPPVSAKPHFTAGVIGFSALMRFEELLDELDTPKSYWFDPVLANVQHTIKERTRRKKHPEITHSLRKLVHFELARSTLQFDGAFDAVCQFLRLLPYKGQPAGDKLRAIRTPLLLVHGANDPLCKAQDVAEFIAGTSNPNVAAIILPGGGHVGFAPFARSYYFSLILNFFDPATGPAARPVSHTS